MKHQVVDARGTRIHCVEEGSGPMVLLVHGFPESWFSWRHQLPAIAEAGFRAVAIDVRGYGRSPPHSRSRPTECFSTSVRPSGVVEGLAGRDAPAIIIGHDWGAPIVAHSALLRPDIFTAVATLSVPYHPPGGRRPTEAFAETGRLFGEEEEFYINYFQEPGRAEREIEIDVRSWLLGFYVGASADGVRSASDRGSMATVARGRMMRDRFPVTDVLPDWLTDEDLEFYVQEFERTGFRGPLNRYRNVDRDWQDLQPWRDAPIHGSVPVHRRRV